MSETYIIKEKNDFNICLLFNTNMFLHIDEFPDDIIDIIYSKIVFKQPKNLLNEIIKYGENREYLYYLNRLDDDLLYDCLYDIVIIYLLICDNIVFCFLITFCFTILFLGHLLLFLPDL